MLPQLGQICGRPPVPLRVPPAPPPPPPPPPPPTHARHAQILRWLVSVWNPREGTVWPRLCDDRYGVVDGLRSIPEFANLTDAEFEERALWDRATGKKTVVGWRDPAVPRDDEDGRPLEVPGMFGLSAPIWRPLSILWDVFVGNCECMPERDAPGAFHSVHFSCLQWFGKPSSFDSEAEFMATVNSTGLSCTRHYYLAWYDVYVRAAGRLPPPLWTGGPVPRADAAHDAKVRAHQAALKLVYDEIARLDNIKIEAEMAEAAAAAEKEAAAAAKGGAAAAPARRLAAAAGGAGRGAGRAAKRKLGR